MRLKLSISAALALLAWPPIPMAVAAWPPLQTASDALAEHQRTAQDAEARGDFETAAREYESLTHSLPNNAELESNLGVAFYFNHKYEKSAAVCRKAISLKPSLYAPHLFLGLSLSRLSRPDAAAPELEKAIAINGQDPLARTWLGYAYASQSRHILAVKQFELATQLLSSQADKQRDRIDLAYALGKSYVELGREATLRLIQDFPDGGRTWQLAAEQADAQGSQAKALSLYLGALRRRQDLQPVRTRIIELGGKIPNSNQPPAASTPRMTAEDALYDKVQQCQKSAKTAFEEITRIDPESYRAHQVIADADVASDKFDDAILEYRKVLQTNPDLPGIHGAICNALLRTAQLQDAAKECAAEIEIAPYSADAYVQAARLSVLTEDDTRAEELLREALQMDRPPVAVYKLLGKVQFDRNQFGEAARNLSHYVAAEPKDASAYYLLSRAYKGLGDTARMKDAIARYRKAADSGRIASDAQQALAATPVSDDIPVKDEEKEP